MEQKDSIIHDGEYGVRVDNAVVKLIIGRERPCDKKIVRMTMHVHSHSEIFVCKKGQMLVTTPGHEYVLSQGDAVIVPAGILHKKTVFDDTEHIAVGVMCVECGGEFIKDSYSFISSYLNSDCVYEFKNKQSFCSSLEFVLKKAVSSDVMIYMLGFVAELFKLFANSSHKCDNTVTRGERNLKNIDRLVKLDYIINTRFMTELSNKQIALELFLSERQLARLVRENYGATLHTLIINKRINAAAVLLDNTDNSVEEIAYSVGFKSKTSFYSDFFKAYGVTPVEYRLKNKDSV